MRTEVGAPPGRRTAHTGQAIDATRGRVYPGAMSTTLARPHDDRILAGVCAAIGRRFDIGSMPVRVLTVIVSLPFFWLAPIVYVTLWILIPDESRASR